MNKLETQFKKGMTPWNKGIKLPYTVWNKGKTGTFTKDTRVIKQCVTCGEDFKVYKCDADKRISCSRECVPKRVSWNKGKKGFLAGEKHYKWIADRTQIKIGDRCLNDPLQKGWRKAVKNRDGWKCRISDSSCSGKLEAHHILPWSEFPELRYEINNGITLCHFHHPRKKEDVKKLSPYFQRLVAEV